MRVALGMTLLAKLGALALILELTFPGRWQGGATTLEELSAHADAIVVGHVVALHCVHETGVSAPTSGTEGDLHCSSGLKVAEVAVDEVLKGGAPTGTLWYSADVTLARDYPNAIPGERSLLFLSQSMWVEEAAVRGTLETLTRGQPLLQVCARGSGRMLIQTRRGVEVVSCERDIVKKPAHNEAVHLILPGWRAPLRDVAAWVRAAVHAQPIRSPRHPVSGLSAAFALLSDDSTALVSIWRDRSVYWRKGLEPGSTSLLKGRLDPKAFSRLEWWCAERDFSLGRPSGHDSKSRPRILVRTPTQSSVIVRPDEDLRGDRAFWERLWERISDLVPVEGTHAEGAIEVR